MGLNIKNERVHALARQAAQVTGKNQTSAIEEALVLLLEQYGRAPEKTARERRFDQLMALSAAYAPPAGGVEFEVHDLYDAQTGLPA